MAAVQRGTAGAARNFLHVSVGALPVTMTLIVVLESLLFFFNYKSYTTSLNNYNSINGEFIDFGAFHHHSKLITN